MRKFDIVVGIVISMVALFCSCSKSDVHSDVQSDVPQKDDKVYLSLIADTPENADETKVEATRVARLYWDNGDEVFVFDESAYLGKLTATVVDGTKNTRAKLNGTITRPSGGYIYLLFSSNFNGTPEIENGTVQVDFSDQGNDNAFATYSVVEFGDDAEEEIKDLVVQFTFASVTFAVNSYNMTGSTPLSSVSLYGVSDICKMKLEGGKVVSTGEMSSASAHITKTLKNLTTSKEGEAMALVAFAPSDATSRRILRFSSDACNFYDFGFYTGKLGPADYVWTICKMTKTDSGNAEFSISSSEKAYIATGNLYWDGNESKYKFESEQYFFRNFGGDDQGSAFLDDEVTSTPANTVGSFYWSRDAEKARALEYEASSMSSVDPFFVDRSDFKINGSEAGYWRAIAKDHMEYMMNERTNMIRTGGLQDDASYAYAVVNGVKGLLLFPDVFVWDKETMGDVPAYVNDVPGSQAYWATAVYTLDQFRFMEAYGARFLPAAGWRSISGGKLKVSQAMQNDIQYGYYWTNTRPDGIAYNLFFKGEELKVQTNPLSRGYHIRPIHVIESIESNH